MQVIRNLGKVRNAAYFTRIMMLITRRQWVTKNTHRYNQLHALHYKILALLQIFAEKDKRAKKPVIEVSNHQPMTDLEIMRKRASKGTKWDKNLENLRKKNNPKVASDYNLIR